jgi:hypothetical protein
MFLRDCRFRLKGSCRMFFRISEMSSCEGEEQPPLVFFRNLKKDAEQLLGVLLRVGESEELLPGIHVRLISEGLLPGIPVRLISEEELPSIHVRLISEELLPGIHVRLVSEELLPGIHVRLVSEELLPGVLLELIKEL